MQPNKETYEKVAEKCSSYESSRSGCGCSNSTANANISCTNCAHFDKDQFCRLDLYDKIINSYNI